MRAIVLHAARDLRLEEVTEPHLGVGEVLIESHAVGVCAWDHHSYRTGPATPFPIIGGHECCGRIVRTGEGVTSVEAGQRVTIRPNFGCGNCVYCRMGRDNLCAHRVSLGVNTNGGFAEYVKAPARYVYPIPESMNDEEGALVEPVAVAYRAVRRMGETLGKKVMILGAGPIGLLVALLAKLGGATVYLSDIIEERLSMGKKLCADEVIDVSQCDPKERAMSLTGGRGMDAVVETAGIAKTFEQALEIVKPGGRVILVGLVRDKPDISIIPLVRREIEIFGSLIYSHEDFSLAIEAVSNGKEKFIPLISHRFPLEDTSKALEMGGKGQGIKLMINPQAGA